MESIRSGKALKKTAGPPEPKSTIIRKYFLTCLQTSDTNKLELGILQTPTYEPAVLL